MSDAAVMNTKRTSAVTPHDCVGKMPTLSYFGTERGPDHPQVDSRTFSSFISAQKTMCLFFGQVPWTHDGYLSQDDATSHSGGSVVLCCFRMAILASL